MCSGLVLLGVDVVALTVEEVRAFGGEVLLDWWREAVLVEESLARSLGCRDSGELLQRVTGEGPVLCGPT